MDYWAWRASRRLDANEEGAAEVLRVLGRAFHRANQDIAADIQRIWDAMGSRYGLTPAEIKRLLEAPCGRAEYLRLLDMIKELGDNPQKADLMAKAAAPGYAHRVGRLENLRDQVLAKTVQLSQQYEGMVTQQLADTIRQAYARAGYDAQALIGYAAPFAGIHEGAVQRIMQAPWSGMQFSQRIWKNQQALTELLNETITSGFMTGRSTRKTIAEVQEKMAVGYRAAERLVRTETAAMIAMADKAAYEKARIKRYRYMATLDSITSKVCMALDDEVFDVADMQIGKNCPPMHPHCRSTTTAVIDGVDLSDAQRRSKDPATGMPVRVSRGMSFVDWKNMQKDIYSTEPVLQEGAAKPGERPADAASTEPSAVDKHVQNAIMDLGWDKLPNQSLSNLETRNWYISMVQQIPSLVDANAPMETRAKQAFDLRNLIKVKARDLMADTDMRKNLDETRAVPAWEALIQDKMKRKGLTREEAIRDIYATATKTNEKVNKMFGLGEETK